MTTSAPSPRAAGDRAGRRAGNAAIQFHADAFVTGRQNLMGRHAAGEGFLRGFLRHADIDRLVVFGDAAAREGLSAFAASVPDARNAGRPAASAATADDPVLSEAGAVWLPGPGLADTARQRNAAGLTGAYSVTGVTHTISSHRAMDVIADLVTGPMQDWDALICTSCCVAQSVGMLFEAREDQLRRRGLRPGARPQLPVIPLGVDAAALDPRAAGAERWRRDWRQRLGIGRHDLVVLFVGRLSFHAKAHPLPMLVALEQAQRSLGRPVHLIQSGWFANTPIEGAYRIAGEELAPSIHHHYVDGRTAEARAGIWYAADVFCSLSDNIQETFGLTPIEAMAAGLPVVVSDWDGYRDTVPDGVVGVRVPTRMPGAGNGADLAAAHADGRLTYDMFCGTACLATEVDIAATRAAFEALLSNSDRRAAMGEAGRRHARGGYDWSVIVRAYQDLWADLADRRAAAGTPGPAVVDHAGQVEPLRPDPFWLFEHYASALLDADTVLLPVPETQAGVVSGLTMNNFGRDYTGANMLTQNLFNRLRDTGRLRLGDAVTADLPASRVLREAGWLLKVGLARVEATAA